jgi:hypothetical protein
LHTAGNIIHRTPWNGYVEQFLQAESITGNAETVMMVDSRRRGFGRPDDGKIGRIIE